MTHDRRPHIRSENQWMRRSPSGLQPEDAMPLKALEPATYAAPSDAQGAGNLDLAEPTTPRQHNLRAPGNLWTGPTCKHLKAALHFIAQRSHGFPTSLPVCFRQRQPPQQLSQTLNTHLLDDTAAQYVSQ